MTREHESVDALLGAPVRRKKRSGTSVLLIVGALAAAAMVVIGLQLGFNGVPGSVFAASGALALVVVLAAWALAGHRTQAPDDAAGLRREIAHLARAVEHMSEQGALSDDARRVLNRRRERELLRGAIEEDIDAEDWDAAMVLVKELAERFGYRADAEEFRQRIDQIRFETVQRKVDEAVRHLDGLILQCRWDQALVEAARVGRLYPDAPRVDGLRHRVEAARQTYKNTLERRFLHAAQEDRIDEAMELLKELDAYLEESEAEQFREVARGVIGKARENLGVQFKLAVQDRRWEDAAAAGQRIVADFPNTRMAAEVRAMLDQIRSKIGSRAAG